jgi:cbb3-type cytochrome oxidase cytochrome c subunit
MKSNNTLLAITIFLVIIYMIVSIFTDTKEKDCWIATNSQGFYHVLEFDGKEFKINEECLK